ncbi:MAG TPA: SAM-dependent methyltransferase, partial [Symbiobacteriaceae bacterium]|nr:SAM-dependent methyltransferase [Symbiobacteriaceae bacterium]
MITIVGLGPGSPGHLTMGALEALKSGRPVLLRTAIHPTV